MAVKTIQVQRLRTEMIADISKQTAGFKKAEGNVEKYGKTVAKVGKDTAKAFDGVSVGKKFGKDIGVSAVAELTSSFSVSTLGGLIGTAIAPGIGTTIGSAIGGGIDTALSKVAPIVLNTISQGIELNKLIEDTRVEFTQMTGSEAEANKYLKDLLGISRDLGILPATVIDTSEELSDLTGSLKTTNILLKAAADQAADFAGTDFHKVAVDLGQIAAQSTLAEKELKKLIKSDAVVNAKKYLAEAIGVKQEEVQKLVSAGRIRGDIAAQIIALGIEREKGGLAAYKTSQTVAGRERQFGVNMQLLGARGTENITKAMGDFYGMMNDIAGGPKAQKVVDFFNQLSGTLINFTKGAVQTGVSVGAGVAEGILNFNPATMMKSLTGLSSFVETGLKTVFEIHSPSELSAREVGEPLGEGIGVGLSRKFRGFMLGQGAEEMKQTLLDLLKSPQIQALLNTIVKAEGGGMNVMAGGRRVNSGALHPGEVVPRSQWFGTSKGKSSASGLFQETVTNWKKAESIFGPLNFSDPNDQKLVALWLMASHQGGLATLRSGDIGKQRGLVAKDWTSTPGSTIGGGGQWSMSKWMGAYQGFLSGGKPIDAGNPMPVRVVKDIEGGAGVLLGYKPSTGSGMTPDQWLNSIIKLGQEQKDLTITYGEADAAIVNVTGSMDALKNETLTAADMDLQQKNLLLRTTEELIPYQERSAEEIASLTQQMKDLGSAAVIGNDALSRVAGTFMGVSGMIPSQQVGKKRGLFSKILGFAAPFLSFIPGVGPILSTIAGAASSAIGGNYGGAASTIAGGFQAGGVFRSSGGGASHRAFGGPVYAGTPYWVGDRADRRPELFVPGQNGRVLTPEQLGGGGLHPELMAMFERLHSVLNRFDSMPADHVVMKGFRGGLRAMDRDSSLTEGYGRRFRLA